MYSLTVWLIIQEGGIEREEAKGELCLNKRTKCCPAGFVM